MSPTSGSLDTFGKALDSIDFFGASAINPTNMQNNCVSVAVAHLHGYSTVQDLWRAIHKSPLPDKPLSFSQIRDLLARTGYNYQWQHFHSNDKKLYEEIIARSPAYHDEFAIVLYTRHGNGGGHAVNLEVSIADWKLPVDLYFTDYQHSGRGSDQWKDVKEAKEVIVLYQAGAKIPGVFPSGPNLNYKGEPR